MNKQLFWIIIFLSVKLIAQNSPDLFSADLDLGYHLARVESNYLFEEKAPFSFQLNWQRSNFYQQKKIDYFGYTDFGASFVLHHYKDAELGTNLGIYAFMEFYLWKPRHSVNLSFRLSQGLAYNTNPYHPYTNPKNFFMGSHILLPIDMFFYLRYPNIYKSWGAEVGLGIFHYSNGNLQSPNYGSNIPSINLGINYNFRKKFPNLKRHKLKQDKNWHLLSLLRFGINESDYIGSGQFPFFIPALQFEKQIGPKAKISLGTEIFFSYFLKEQIAYESRAFPEFHIDSSTDFKRMGVFASYEFYFYKMGIDLGTGYYVYYPYTFESRMYSRLMLKFYLNPKMVLGYSLKAHKFSRAEAFEFYVGYKLF